MKLASKKKMLSKGRDISRLIMANYFLRKDSNLISQGKYKDKMKKIVAFFMLAVLLAPGFALADGGIVHFDPYSDRWDFADETNQQAFINYEKGVEKMILSVGVGDLREGKTMWIFPIPANPNKVAVDVVTKLPILRGEEISQKAQSNLDDALGFLQATQIYTLPFASTHTLGGSSSFDGGMPASTGLGGSFKNATRPDVVIYEHLEKEGITSEIITATTAQGFNEYFSKKGLKIESSSIPVLQNYIGKEYSFVVSWMEQKELFLTNEDIVKIIRSGSWSGNMQLDANAQTQAFELVQNLNKKYPGFSERGTQEGLDGKNKLSDIETNELKQGIKDHSEILQMLNNSKNQKGVFVSFPTEKIFFPLMPTSIYGSKTVPAEIRVMGHVTPDVFADIESFTKTEYYHDESIQFDKDLKAFYDGSSTDIKYTKIGINAPSKFFTEDLWMKNTAPVKTFYQMFLARQFLLVVFFLIAICSVTAGVLVGLLLFREWRNWEVVEKFGLIGLANCLTILGMIALLLPSNTKKDAEDATSLIQNIKEKGYFWKRRILLGVMIADFPFLLLSLLLLCLVLPQELSHQFFYGSSIFETLFSPVILFSFVPVIIFLAAFLFAKNIKKVDEYLFEGLKEKNYSAWTFQPRDKRKIAFIIVYSIVFLIISWVVVKLFVLSVGGQMIDSGRSGIQF
jgi:hypothetical protein